jgi:hypothetical protein
VDRHYRLETEAQAKKARCCRALRALSGQPGLYGATLTRIGKALSTVGDRLQKRYGQRAPQPLPHPTYWPDATYAADHSEAQL